MNLVTIGIGVVLLAAGFRVLVSKLRDPAIRLGVAALKKPEAANGEAIASFTTGFVVPVATMIAIGTAFVVLGVIGRAPALLDWFGR